MGHEPKAAVADATYHESYKPFISRTVKLIFMAYLPRPPKPSRFQTRFFLIGHFLSLCIYSTCSHCYKTKFLSTVLVFTHSSYSNSTEPENGAKSKISGEGE